MYPTRPIFHLLALGLMLGIIGSCWACQGSRWVCEASRWVRQTFWIPTCRYLVALGVKCLRVECVGGPIRWGPNARAQCERVRIQVEYRLKVRVGIL